MEPTKHNVFVIRLVQADGFPDAYVPAKSRGLEPALSLTEAKKFFCRDTAQNWLRQCGYNTTYPVKHLKSVFRPYPAVRTEIDLIGVYTFAGSFEVGYACPTASHPKRVDCRNCQNGFFVGVRLCAKRRLTCPLCKQTMIYEQNT